MVLIICFQNRLCFNMTDSTPVSVLFPMDFLPKTSDLPFWNAFFRGEAALRSPAPCIQLLKICADNNIDIQVARLREELVRGTAAELAKTLEDQLRLDLGLAFGRETNRVRPREVVERVASSL